MRVNGRPSIHHGHLCTSLGRAHDPSVRQLPLPTLRERAVLHALVDGLTSTESAARLGRAPQSVEAAVGAAGRTLGATDATRTDQRYPARRGGVGVEESVALEV